MNGIHDMGGMHGFGEVNPKENDAVFHAPWESRLFAIHLSMIRHKPLDPGGTRVHMESLSPIRYLSSSYYERFLIILENALLEKGLLTREEMQAKSELYRDQPSTPLPERSDPTLIEQTLDLIHRRHPSRRDPGSATRFAVGDSVRALNINPRGHTRLPSYIRSKTGVVDRVQGLYGFQDTDGDFPRGQPQPVYCVEFEARELWGESAESNSKLYADLWECYLEPA